MYIDKYNVSNGIVIVKFITLLYYGINDNTLRT